MINLDEDELKKCLAVIHGFRQEYGREHEPFAVTVGMPAKTIDEMRRLEDLGVTCLAVAFRNPYEPDRMPLQHKIDWIKRFGDEVIAKY